MAVVLISVIPTISILLNGYSLEFRYSNNSNLIEWLQFWFHYSNNSDLTEWLQFWFHYSNNFEFIEWLQSRVPLFQQFRFYRIVAVFISIIPTSPVAWRNNVSCWWQIGLVFSEAFYMSDCLKSRIQRNCAPLWFQVGLLDFIALTCEAHPCTSRVKFTHFTSLNLQVVRPTHVKLSNAKPIHVKLCFTKLVNVT